MLNNPPNRFFLHLLSSWLPCQGEGLALPERQTNGQWGDPAGWWQQGDDWWLRGPYHLWQPGLHGRHPHFLRQPGTWEHVAFPQKWVDAELQSDADNAAQPGGSGKSRGRYVIYRRLSRHDSILLFGHAVTDTKGNQELTAHYRPLLA